MKKIITTSLLTSMLILPSLTSADELEGLNVIITSGDTQTQMMGMVLSTMTQAKLKKQVNITLCSNGGNLALKDYVSPSIKKADGTMVNPQKALQGLIKGGANVTVCPLFLPNVSKDSTALIDGVTIAKPQDVAAHLINSNYNNISF